MNLILLGASEIGALLPIGDRRVAHIVRVLRKGPGDELLAGLLVEEACGSSPCSIGRARIQSLDERGLVLTYRPERMAPTLHRLRIVLGFPRPIQASRLLKELTSLGIAELLFTGTELGEKSYLESDFWKKGEYRQALIEGAEQAANPRLPRVTRTWTLERALLQMDEESWRGGSRIFLHPGGGHPRLGAIEATAPATIAVGSERGWTARELALLEHADGEGAAARHGVGLASHDRRVAA
ncbi:MAG: RsmE family RNA methyltransferase, partial [Spirochaetota bacterium]